MLKTHQNAWKRGVSAEDFTTQVPVTTTGPGGLSTRFARDLRVDRGLFRSF